MVRKFSPDPEMNSTFYDGAPNDRKQQAFPTTGIGLGRHPVWRRLEFAGGGAVQIAASRFHTYDLGFRRRGCRLRKVNGYDPTLHIPTWGMYGSTKS